MLPLPALRPEDVKTDFHWGDSMQEGVRKGVLLAAAGLNWPAGFPTTSFVLKGITNLHRSVVRMLTIKVELMIKNTAATSVSLEVDGAYSLLEAPPQCCSN